MQNSVVVLTRNGYQRLRLRLSRVGTFWYSESREVDFVSTENEGNSERAHIPSSVNS